MGTRRARAPRLPRRYTLLRDGRVFPLLRLEATSLHPRHHSPRAARPTPAHTHPRTNRCLRRRSLTRDARARRYGRRSTARARPHTALTATMRGRRVGSRLDVQVRVCGYQDRQPRADDCARSQCHLRAPVLTFPTPFAQAPVPLATRAARAHVHHYYAHVQRARACA